jgi:hypothetical protein
VYRRLKKIFETDAAFLISAVCLGLISVALAVIAAFFVR